MSDEEDRGRAGGAGNLLELVQFDNNSNYHCYGPFHLRGETEASP